MAWLVWNSVTWDGMSVYLQIEDCVLGSFGFFFLFYLILYGHFTCESLAHGGYSVYAMLSIRGCFLSFCNTRKAPL